MNVDTLIKWDPGYSVGIEGFDNEHKILINLLNSLHEAMINDPSHANTSEIIKELLNYTETHFKSEEATFEKYGYPKAQEHKDEHDYFIRQVKKFQKQDEEGGLAISMQLLYFMKEWIYTHIVGTDKEYSEFLNEKGVH